MTKSTKKVIKLQNIFILKKITYEFILNRTNDFYKQEHNMQEYNTTVTKVCRVKILLILYILTVLLFSVNSWNII